MANQMQRVTPGRLVSQAIGRIAELVEGGQLDIPAGYSYKNAIQQARFALCKPIETGRNKGRTIFEVCTPASMLESIILMAEKGLNPGKAQCYFIPYGTTCTLMESYQGRLMQAKRDGKDISDVYAYAVYAGEKFQLGYDMERGIQYVEAYEPDVSKWKKENLIGAFAAVLGKDRYVVYSEYMTMEQIRAAWAQGGASGVSPAHKNFPDQMAIKTVINRAVKNFVNSSTDDVEITPEAVADRELAVSVAEEANAEVLDFPEPEQLPGKEKEPAKDEEKAPKPEEAPKEETPLKEDEDFESLSDDELMSRFEV